jgi:hypothetical protein
MKIIQTIADIEELKARSTIPFIYLKEIEAQFLEWYEAEGEDDELVKFRLPFPSCIYHLEDQEDASFIADHILEIEYIEKEETEECGYFRIGLMKGHQMSLVYFLEGTLGERFEQWLQN